MRILGMCWPRDLGLMLSCGEQRNEQGTGRQDGMEEEEEEEEKKRVCVRDRTGNGLGALIGLGIAVGHVIWAGRIYVFFSALCFLFWFVGEFVFAVFVCGM